MPGTAAPVMIEFQDVAGSSCGALLPTGHERDTIEGVEVTCIDNGMPVVLIRAADLGKTGYESPDALEADTALREKVERIRLAAGPMMNLGECDTQERAEDVPDRTARPWRATFRPAPSSPIAFIRRSGFLAPSVSPPLARCPVRWRPAWQSWIRQPMVPTRSKLNIPTGFFSISAQIEIENGTPVVRRAAPVAHGPQADDGRGLCLRPVLNIALIGYGEVGSIFARELRAMGVQAIRAFDTKFLRGAPADAQCPGLRQRNRGRDGSESDFQRRHRRRDIKRRAFGLRGHRQRCLLRRS